MTESKEMSELYKLFKKAEENDRLYTIEATVDTGLEWQAVDECKEMIDPTLHVVKERGRIYFNISLDKFTRVTEMRSIDNILVISDVREFEFSKDDAEADMTLIKRAVNEEMRLEKGINGWKRVTDFRGKVYPTLEEFENAVKSHKAEKSRVADEAVVEDVRRGRKRGRDPSISTEDDVLKYRVTCERTGIHAFDSGMAARVIGGELQDKYNWLVDLTMYHLEVVCNVVKNQLVTCLRVTHESKHRRNIVHFGPTTLRATVCYSLIRLANPKLGEIVMDPMCGGGSIPIEASIAFPNTFVICGDNHEKAVDRTKANLEEQSDNRKTDLIRWSVAQMPLKDSYVDIVVTDMVCLLIIVSLLGTWLGAWFHLVAIFELLRPFGKRSGSMTDNRVLYKRYLAEFGRVSKLGTGRLVLLTYDRRSIQVALQSTGHMFRVTKMLGVNMGGLNAAVYVLKRTKLPHDQEKPKNKFEPRSRVCGK